MTDRYADLRAALDARAKGGSAGYERYLDKATPETIRALLADYDRMRRVLNEAVRVLESARLLCNWPSMNEAIDAAARDGRAALAQEQGGSDGN